MKVKSASDPEWVNLLERMERVFGTREISAETVDESLRTFVKDGRLKEKDVPEARAQILAFLERSKLRGRKWYVLEQPRPGWKTRAKIALYWLIVLSLAVVLWKMASP